MLRQAILAILLVLASARAFAGGNNFDDHSLLPSALISNAVTSGAAVTSSVVDIRTLKDVGLQFNLGAKTAAGNSAWYVDISEDYTPANAGSWTTLSFASATTSWSTEATAATAGTPAAVFYAATPAATFYREIPNTSAAYLRVRWVPTTTSAGVFSVYVSGK